MPAALEPLSPHTDIGAGSRVLHFIIEEGKPNLLDPAGAGLSSFAAKLINDLKQGGIL